MAFSTIQFQTSSGENCIATKKDGIVTIQGDKNGVRQQQLKDFMADLIKDQQSISLERTPQNDKVSFKGNREQQVQIQQNFSSDELQNVEKRYSFKKKFWSWNPSYKMTGEGVDLKIKDGFWGTRTVKGNINGKEVDLKMKSEVGKLFSSDKTTIEGKIGENDVNLQMKPNLSWGKVKTVDLSGEINSGDKDITTLLSALALNKHMTEREELMVAMMC